MTGFRRRRRDDDSLGHPGLGDGEAPGGWHAGEGGSEPDPLAPPRRRRWGGARTAEPGEAGPREPRPPLAAVAFLGAVLVVGLVADHLVGTGQAAEARTVRTPLTPSLAPAGALSSSWFCPALQATARSDALGRIIIANPGPAALTGKVTVTPSAGPPVVKSAAVAPYTRMTYKLEDVAPGAYAATTVSLDGDTGAVEQEVQGPLGQSIAPCASASSDRWYFAAGRTDTDASELLSLYNPYPAPAIADLSFVTDQGPTTPDAFQGLVIPGRGFNVVDVGRRVRIRAAVAATVSVRSGRLVVDKLQMQSGKAGSAPRGLSLTLGATALGSTWYYPDGVSGKGLTEDFEIYNPGQREARVRLSPTLEVGAADPFDMTVPPDDAVSLRVDQQARIPPGIGQAWVLTSTNGVPVVGERVIVSVPPAAHTGIGDTMGSPRLSRRWVFPAGSAIDNADEWIVIFNPGGRRARVSFMASGTGAPHLLGGPGGMVLAPGTRRALEIRTVYPQGIVVVEVRSDVPVVAERAQFNVGSPGLSDTVGIAAAP